jgi:FG-GAP-like repeat
VGTSEGRKRSWAGRAWWALGGVALVLGVLVGGAASAGRTDLSFAPGPPAPAGPAPASAAVADLNGDGKLDVAVGNGGYWNDVRILLGDDAGGFREHGSPLPVGAYPRAMGIADFDGDGIVDLAVVTRAKLVKILRGDGSGGVAANGSSVAAGGEPVGLAHADLNRDGKEDVVVSVWRNGYRLTILLGDGAGGFAAPSELSIGGSSANNPRISVAAADLTGDGKPDLAAANSLSAAIWLWRGDGTGGFAPRQAIVAAQRPGPLAVGDVNGDGKTDLVAVVGKGTEALLGDGSGGFRPTGPPAAVRGGSLAVADFNGDTKPDFAVADGAAGWSPLRSATAPGGSLRSPFRRSRPSLRRPSPPETSTVTGRPICSVCRGSGRPGGRLPAGRRSCCRPPRTPQFQRRRNAFRAASSSRRARRSSCWLRTPVAPRL